MERALKTANTVFKGKVIKVNALKELAILPLMKSKIRLPFIIWAIVVRIKVASSNKITNEFKATIIKFLNDILAENSEDMLLVSHVFVMLFLQKELKKRGFEGANFQSPANGKVYVFEKK